SGELHIWGFRGTRFVVWNESKQLEILSVECGGAHRSFTYTPQASTNSRPLSTEVNDGAGAFVYTRASRCKTYLQKGNLFQKVQVFGHGREIKACASAFANGSLN